MPVELFTPRTMAVYEALFPGNVRTMAASKSSLLLFQLRRHHFAGASSLLRANRQEHQAEEQGNEPRKTEQDARGKTPTEKRTSFS